MERQREQALIRLAQRGDAQAFAELYRAHVDSIYRYLYYRINTVTTAEDLTADVFMKALEGLAGYQDRATPFLAWLYRIARARLVDYYRRSKHADDHEDIDAIELGADHDLDAALIAAHQSDHMQTALRTLTDEQQQVIVLRFVEGHSVEKTAELLGKTEGAIKAMQHRALQALGRALERQGFRPQGD
jgi:RNA polymerase sigma-70 factor (ECF subfamily)